MVVGLFNLVGPVFHWDAEFFQDHLHFNAALNAGANRNCALSFFLEHDRVRTTLWTRMSHPTKGLGQFDQDFRFNEVCSHDGLSQRAIRKFLLTSGYTLQGVSQEFLFCAYLPQGEAESSPLRTLRTKHDCGGIERGSLIRVVHSPPPVPSTPCPSGLLPRNLRIEMPFLLLVGAMCEDPWSP